MLFCQGSTFDERRRLLCGAWAKKTLWAMAGWDSQHHQHGGQVLLPSDVITLNLLSRRLILGDTFNADKLRYTAKEMLLANSKKLDSIPDWRNKLATRTELVLEVLGELARSSLWTIITARYYFPYLTPQFHKRFSLLRKELIDISVIQSWMMKIRITLSLNNSKYILVTLNMSIVNTYLVVRELDTFAEEVDRKETCKTLILSHFWLL